MTKREEENQQSYVGRGTFFAAADETAAGLLHADGFERSLVYNLLFGSHLVIDEPFFFNSSLLREHVAKANTHSLFEVAAKRGLISPAFHVQSSQTMEVALDRMRSTYAPGFMPTELDSPYRAIVRAVNEGMALRPSVHPLEGFHLATGYKDAVESYFLTNTQPQDLNDDEWRSLSRWSALIPEACAATAARGFYGLQRAELVRSIHRQLDVPGDAGIQPIDWLIDRCLSAEDGRALGLFWQKMNQLHWLNSAQSFALSTSLPSYSVNKSSTGEQTEMTILCINVRLPQFKALLRVDPVKLVDARVTYGSDFFSIIAEPSIDSENIARTFGAYSSHLCKLASDEKPAILGYKPVTMTAYGLSSAAAIATGAAGFIAGHLGQSVANIANVTSAGAVMIGVGLAVAAARQTRTVQRRFEITLPFSSSNRKSSP